MLAELGLIALQITLSLALLLTVLPNIRSIKWRRLSLRYALSLSYVTTLFATLTLLILLLCFINDDFSVRYVAQHSHQTLPLSLKIAALWGGYEGSLLFWLFSITLWMFAITCYYRKKQLRNLAQVLSIMALLVVLFALFILLFSNPFTRLLPAPSQGGDLNPMLQHIGMVLHPPLLYLGYSGLAVCFAFTLTDLLQKKKYQLTVYHCRPWLLIAWSLLTAGIALGSWWAYGELGWGGWWFWDPVENVSLLPWLSATALLHARVAAEQRGNLLLWTLLLSIMSWLFSLLGTFTVRSGLISSIHAFALDHSAIGLLLFLSVISIAALLLFALRAPLLSPRQRNVLLAADLWLLASLLLFTLMIFIIFLGTFYPLFAFILGWGTLSVGAPYFNHTLLLPWLLLLILMGLGTLQQWRSHLFKVTSLRLLAAASLSALLPWVIYSHSNIIASLMLVPAFLLCYSCCWQLLRTPWWQWGKNMAHLGIGLLAIGMVLSSYYSQELQQQIKTGSTVTLAQQQLTYLATEHHNQDNYSVERLTFRLTDSQGYSRLLHPERRYYPVRQQWMNEPAIATRFTEDIYLLVSSKLAAGEYTIRLYYRPFISLIWLAAFCLVVSSVIAIIGRNYRARQPQEQG